MTTFNQTIIHSPSSILPTKNTMKSCLLFICTLLLVVFTRTESNAEQHFEPTWGSLAKNPLPEWVKDAKFGVYTHWGIYSVPAHGGPDTRGHEPMQKAFTPITPKNTDHSKILDTKTSSLFSLPQSLMQMIGWASCMTLVQSLEAYAWFIMTHSSFGTVKSTDGMQELWGPAVTSMEKLPRQYINTMT